MEHEKITIGAGEADGYVIPLGPANLVFVVTGKGLLGCGAFDVCALDGFGYPASRVRSRDGKPVASIDDLLSGIVREANESAKKLGIKADMPARKALELCK